MFAQVVHDPLEVGPPFRRHRSEFTGVDIVTVPVALTAPTNSTHVSEVFLLHLFHTQFRADVNLPSPVNIENSEPYLDVDFNSNIYPIENKIMYH